MAALLAWLVPLATLSFLLSIGAGGIALRRISRSILVSPRDADLPPLSVLKPLRGLDEGLFENLAACARQDYPAFELILGCEDPNDPALAVARELQLAFPRVPIEIVAGTPPFGYNPKVVALAALARRARHDHVVISDANVRPAPNYLRDLAATLVGPRDGEGPAALASSVLAGVDSSNSWTSLGAMLENLQFNSFVVSSVVAASEIGHPCVVGKSMLFRLSDLRKLGGFRAVADVLAEDYEIGRRFHALGFRVALCPVPLAVHHERRTFLEFWHRHLRWAAMRRSIAPWAYWGEPLLNPMPFLFATALVANQAGSKLGVALCLAGALAKMGLDLALVRALTGRAASFLEVAAIPLKDLAGLAIWVAGLFRSTVDWRGHRLRIGRGSRLTPIEEPFEALESMGEPMERLR